jgi:hypothetical protein
VVTTTDGEWLIPPRLRGRGGRFFYPATFSANITTGQVGTSSPRNAASSWRLRPSGVSQASLMASLTSGMLPRPLLMHPDERDTRDGFHDESPNRVLFSVATSSKSTLLEEIGSVMSRIGQLSDKDCLECSSKRGRPLWNQLFRVSSSPWPWPRPRAANGLPTPEAAP